MDFPQVSSYSLNGVHKTKVHLALLQRLMQIESYLITSYHHLLVLQYTPALTCGQSHWLNYFCSYWIVEACEETEALLSG